MEFTAVYSGVYRGEGENTKGQYSDYTEDVRQRLGEVLVCGLDCSRVDFLQLWEGGGEELDGEGELETDWTWREEEAGRQRQLDDHERTRPWVCNRPEEYVLPHEPIHNQVPTPPRVLAPHGGQDSLSPSPPSPSLPIRNNLVKIEAALAKFDLLSDIVAIHRKEQSLYSGDDSGLEAELGDYYENEKAWPEAYSRRGINSVS